MKNLTYSLYSLKNTVFSTQEISLILKESSLDRLKSKINYFVKKGELMSLRKGLYAKVNGFEILEVANKIFTPSYISLETVLKKGGVTFQDYSKTIFVLSYQTRDIKIGEYTISFKKIKDNVLTNPIGVIEKDGYSIASLERAFLDRIYLSNNYYFDNLSPINWKKARAMLKIYNNSAMERRYKKYVKDFHS